MSEITTHKDGRCVYFANRNIVVCPTGQVLYPRFYKKSNGHGVFHNYTVCQECTCRCTKQTRGCRHSVPMAASNFSKEYDDTNLFVKQIRIKPDKELIKQRKSIVEHPFATIKRSMDAGYCLTKGLQNVSGEFSLAFLAYNLKRVINIMGVKEIIRAISMAQLFQKILFFTSRISPNLCIPLSYA